MTPDQPDRLVTANEAAELTGRSVQTIRYWAWHGDLPVAERDSLKHYQRFRLADVLRLHRERAKTTRGASNEEAARAIAKLRAERAVKQKVA